VNRNLERGRPSTEKPDLSDPVVRQQIRRDAEREGHRALLTSLSLKWVLTLAAGVLGLIYLLLRTLP